MFTFGKHIRELAVEFTCFLKILLGKTTSLLLFQGGNTLGIFFLTVYVTIKIPRISLHITNQVIHIQIMLLPNICFDFSSSHLKVNMIQGT